MLGGGEDQEGVRLGAEVEVLGEGARDEEPRVRLHLQQVVLALPDERNALELTQRVPLLDLLVEPREAHVRLRQHEVEDQLLAPADYALDDIEAQHAQTVQNVDTLFEKGHIGFVAIDTASLVVILDDLAQFNDLGEARFSGYDGANGGLDWRLLLLQVFNLFDDQR